MIAGVSFPDRFSNDLYSARRSGTVYTSGNPFDPESLLTGCEADAGYTYENSRRYWPSEEHYRRAVGGEYTRDEIVNIAPRVLCEFITVRPNFELYNEDRTTPFPEDEQWAIIRHPLIGVRALHVGLLNGQARQFEEWPRVTRDGSIMFIQYNSGRRCSSGRPMPYDVAYRCAELLHRSPQ